MKDPKPINLMTDDEFRRQGWPFISRDADGHAMSSTADDREPYFSRWCADEARRGHRVIRLAGSNEPDATSQQDGK